MDGLEVESRANSMDGNSIGSKCVHEMFEEQVWHSPRETAIVSPETNWSYAHLNACANQVANRLRSIGVTRGSLVGVCVPRSPQAIAALLGILKAGGAFVPLDLSYPAERLKFMLEDTQLRYLIADETARLKLGAILDESLNLVDIDGLAHESVDFVPGPCTSTDLAYIMYTSGSTGRPKGVMIEHRGITRLVSNPNYMSITSDDVFLQLAPLSFDASTFEIWAALLNGCRLAIMPPHSPSLGEIADAVKHYRVTTLWLTSGLFSALIDEYPDAFRDLKQLLSGGDVLSPSHVRKALDAMPHGCVINAYGPTENTTFTCCHRVRLEDTINSIPIGKPINETEMFILRPDRQLVEGAEIGEIYVGGNGLARGYWNRPELTEEKFVKNPFAADSAELLYRTGDLGHYNSRGEVEFDGRIDLQVKIRGFRIELPEIETVVQTMPGIAAAAVLVKHGGAEEKRLSCFFVPQTGVHISTTELATFVGNKLPSYMIPSEFIPLNELPLTANGKIDRNKLKEIKTELTATVSMRETAASSLELQLAGMWKSLLRVPNVALDDDFFELGGHSLLAARLFAQIHSKFGKKLPLATMLKARTVRQLAAMIRDEHWVAPWSPLVALKPSGTRQPLFLVHAIGGNILSYKDLALNFPADQPLYALQARGLDGKSAPAASIKEMAADYIRGIHAIQPNGPYFLGGFSAGGIVALEMARQLQQAGSSVALLAILDSSIEPGVINLLRKTCFVESFRQVERVIKSNLRYMAYASFPEFLRKKCRNTRMNLRIVIFNLRNLLSRRFHLSPPSHLPVEEAFIRAISHYEPTSYRGYTAVFRTKDAVHDSTDGALGWGNIVEGDLEILEVPGNHDDMLKEAHLSVLVERLTSVLDRARSSAGRNSLTGAPESLPLSTNLRKPGSRSAKPSASEALVEMSA